MPCQGHILLVFGSPGKKHPNLWSLGFRNVEKANLEARVLASVRHRPRAVEGSPPSVSFPVPKKAAACRKETEGGMPSLP